jgi:D-alanyl-D-alanine carboxypeptidase
MAKAAARLKSAPVASRIYSGASPSPDSRVPIPPHASFNANLSSADEATMIRLLGVPGAKTSECGPVTGTIKSRIVSAVDVGPFKVSGLDFAVDLLKQVFEEAQQQIPDVVASVKTAGMLCVRAKRTNPNSFSNHSWGTAIDLYFGKDVVPQKVQQCHQGCLQLAPFFNNHGWYWGAGFGGASVDSMHFELAREAIDRKYGQGG